MKVVFDTNVIVAAFASRGLCSDLFELCLKRHTIILSENILTEVQKVFIKKINLPKAKNNAILQFLRQTASFIKPVALPLNSCRDPEDLHILGAAVRADAQVIVTGDEDLLVLRKFKTIFIVTPREFYTLLTQNPL